MKTAQILIRVSVEERDLFRNTSDKEKMSLSDWIRCNLKLACEFESKPEKVKPTKEPVVYIGAKLTPSEEKELNAALSTKEEDRKCCACHLPGQHYARNRWFCDSHRP